MNAPSPSSPSGPDKIKKKFDGIMKSIRNQNGDTSSTFTLPRIQPVSLIERSDYKVKIN